MNSIPDNLDGLLDDLIQIGDHLYTAVAERDVDRMHTHLEERAELLAQIETRAETSSVSDHPRWQQVNEQLVRQHQRLTKAFTEYRTELQEELEEISALKQAHTAYHRPEKDARQILNSNVRG